VLAFDSNESLGQHDNEEGEVMVPTSDGEGDLVVEEDI
jgi:hypothetical protein